MSFSYPTWNSLEEPNQGNVQQWLDNLYSKFQPIEQARWNQSNIDSLFYAGSQSYVNSYYNFQTTSAFQKYYFNLIQQPINMMTGYQRQHRKAASFVPVHGADPTTTDQYTRLVDQIMSLGGIHDSFSKGCELAAISGMVLAQPYLDYTEGDQVQGELKVKIWEYNSFIVDPFFRKPDMSDCQFVWCQEYISKNVALARFGDKAKQIVPMMGNPQQLGRFYFLPENYNMARNDLLILSYIWYKWPTKKKKIYSRSRDQLYDFGGNEELAEFLLTQVKDFELVEVEVPAWKSAVILNNQLMYLGDNPLNFTSCPFVPLYWNYDPQIADYSMRVRSLVRPLRDPQFLFNYKVITNNDIAAATINSGYKRKVGAVANEDNLKQAQNGYDILINPGYELSDVEKIIPTVVPQSDLELAQQMANLIFSTSGIDLENWAGQQDKQISSLTMVLKQAANLMVFQKYFDQWDYALKILAEKILEIALYNWNSSKIGMMIGEEPTPFFFSKMFLRYQCVVEEALLTPTQKNLQAQQMLDINAAFGREVLPPSMIIKNMNVQGKEEIMEFLQNQEMQSQEIQQQQMLMAHTAENARLQELYSKAAANIAMARERHGRAESNIGLFEERLSEITRNRALATKDKMEAVEKLVDVIAKYGELEAALGVANVQNLEQQEDFKEDKEKVDARRTALSNNFVQELLSSMPQQQEPAQPNPGSLAEMTEV